MEENIEEDIEKVSDFINAIGEEYEVVREQQSFNRIVSDYKRELKENEQLTLAVNSLKKDIKELKHKYDKALSDLVKVEKENKELNRLIAHKNRYTQQLEKDLFENCSNYVISKQKVKDKIEELEKAYEESKDEYGETPYYYPNYTIEILQDLLEEKGE